MLRSVPAQRAEGNFQNLTWGLRKFQHLREVREACETHLSQKRR